LSGTPKALVRGKSTDGPISKYLNRRLSMRLTELIIKYGVPLTPNQVSLISFLIGIASATSYVIGNYLLGAVLIQLSSIIDGVDGELARALGKASALGGFVDALLDRFVDLSVIAAITYSLITSGTVPVALAYVVGTAALTGDLLVSYLHARGEASLKTHPALIGSIPNLASRDVRLFIIFLLTLLNLKLLALITVATLAYTYVLSKLVEVYLRLKSLGGGG